MRKLKIKWKSKKGLPPVGSKKGKICESKWCRNIKGRKADGYLIKHCWKCRSRKLKERRPHTYVLNAIRRSAKKRHLAFTLTLEQFVAFCERTGYMEKRGVESHSLTIDRVNHAKGYHHDNITVTTHFKNSLNGHTVPGQFRQQNYRRDMEPPEPCQTGSGEDSAAPF